MSELLKRFCDNLGVDHEEMRKTVIDRVINDSPAMLSKITSAIADQCVSELDTLTSRPFTLVPYRLTSEQKEFLSDIYPDRNFRFSGQTNHQHPLAAISRRLETELMLSLAKGVMDCHRGQYFHIDVGGSPTVYSEDILKKHRVHSCSPVLGAYDSLRATKRNLKKLNSNYSFCTRVAESCPLTSRVLLFIQSIYDITVEQFGDIMNEKCALVAYGTYFFDPSILTTTMNDTHSLPSKFGILYRKYREGGVIYIDFFFKDDVSLVYKHRYCNYVKMVTSNGITRDSRTYAIEHHLIGGCLYYFQATKLTSAYDGRSLLKHYHFFPDDTVLISVWTYDPAYAVPSSVKLVRNFVSLPKPLFEEIYKYGLTKNEGQFTIQNLTSAAVSFSSRIIVNGTSVTAGHSIEAVAIPNVVTAIYLMIYEQRYNMGQSLKAVQVDIENERRQVDRSLFGLLKDRLFSVQPFEKISALRAFLLSSRRFTTKLPSVSEMFEYSDYLRVLTSEDVFPVDEIVVDERDGLVENLRGVVADYFNQSRMDKNVPVATQCDLELTEVPVPGDGDCMYHSVIHLMGLSTTVDELKREILDTSPPESLRYQLTTPHAHGCTDILGYFATLRGVAFCVHSEHGSFVVGSESSRRYHLRHSGQHFTPLVTHALPPLVEIVDQLVDRSDAINLKYTEDIIDRASPISFGREFYGYSVGYLFELSRTVTLDMSRVLDVGLVKSPILKYLDALGHKDLSYMGNYVDPPACAERLWVDWDDASLTLLRGVRDFSLITNMNLDVDNLTQFLKLVLCKLAMDGSLVVSAHYEQIERMLSWCRRFFNTVRVYRPHCARANSPSFVLYCTGRVDVRDVPAEDLLNPSLEPVRHLGMRHELAVNSVHLRRCFLDPNYNRQLPRSHLVCYPHVRLYGGGAMMSALSAEVQFPTDDVEDALLSMMRKVPVEIVVFEPLRSSTPTVDHSTPAVEKPVVPVPALPVVPISEQSFDCGIVAGTLDLVDVVEEPVSQVYLRLEGEARFNPQFVVPRRRGDECRNAVREYVEYCRVVVHLVTANCKHIYESLKTHSEKPLVMASVLGNFPETYGRCGRKWIVRPESEEYRYAYDGVGLRHFSKHDDELLVVNDRTRLLLETDLYGALNPLLSGLESMELPEFVFVQGIPGCGKSTAIVQRHVPGDLVLTSTKDSATDLYLRTVRFKSQAVQENYRTVSSYLMHPTRRTRHKTLWVDEALMSHPGVIIAAALFSGCERVYLYGDKLQIPYINRDSALNLKYCDLSKLVVCSEYMTKSYRCPRDVIRVFSPKYEAIGAKGISTENRKTGTMQVIHYSSESQLPVKRSAPPDTIVLTFKQAEKARLLILGFQGVKTVHEFQGLQAKHIILVRMSDKPKDTIYNSEPHVLVALTRHTSTLRYYTKLKSSDEITSVILRSGRLVGGGVVGPGCVKVIEGRPSSEVVLLRPSIGERAKGRLCVKTRTRAPVDYSMIKRQLKRSREYVLDYGDLLVCGIQPYAFRDCLRSMGFGVFIRSYGSPSDGSDLELARRLLDANGIVEGVYRSVDEVQEFSVLTVDSPLEPTTVLDVQLLQFHFDTILPGHSLVDQSFDEYVVHTSDLDLNLENVRFTRQRDIYKSPNYDTLRPVLRTSMPYPRQCTFRETMLAVLKRNLNVAQLCLSSNDDILAKAVMSRFSEVFEVPEFDLLEINSSMIQDWLAGQPPGCLSRLETEELAYWTRRMDQYDLIIKRSPKPKLDASALGEYLSLQTVCYQGPITNAIFCPIFREMKKRLVSILPAKYLLYCDMSPEDFQEKLDTLGALVGNYIEVDMSKYDKSQGRILFEFELLLYARLGMPKFFLDMWSGMHRQTVLNDRANKFKAKVTYQRKSGDAATFFGNTVVLMAMLASVFDMSDCVFGVFSGDDSWMVFKNPPPDTNEFLTNIYNMESKIYSYNYPYFCSKFLLYTSFGWRFVPDPVKILVKLGRHDIRNWEHLAEYKTSMLDLLSSFRDVSLAHHLACAVSERYSVPVSPFLFSYIYSAVSHIENLFYSLPSDKHQSGVNFILD